MGGKQSKEQSKEPYNLYGGAREASPWTDDIAQLFWSDTYATDGGQVITRPLWKSVDETKYKPKEPHIDNKEFNPTVHETIFWSEELETHARDTDNGKSPVNILCEEFIKDLVKAIEKVPDSVSDDDRATFIDRQIEKVAIGVLLQAALSLKFQFMQRFLLKTAFTVLALP